MVDVKWIQMMSMVMLPKLLNISKAVLYIRLLEFDMSDVKTLDCTGFSLVQILLYIFKYAKLYKFYSIYHSF